MAPARRVTSTSRTRSHNSRPKSKAVRHPIPRPPQPAPQFGHTTTSSSMPSLENYQAVEAEYLESLSARKRDKALIDLPLFQNIWNILTYPEDAQYELQCTPQLRFWVKKMFSIRPAPLDTPDSSSSTDPNAVQFFVFHNDRPVAVREKLYEILCSAHEASNHGGRDRTDVLVRSLYSYVPKDLVNRFVSICPTCRRKKATNSRYRYLPWAIEAAANANPGEEQATAASETGSEDDSADVMSASDEEELLPFGPGPGVQARKDAWPPQLSHSAGTELDVRALPIIRGWDGPTTNVSDDQMHLPDAAQSIINARSHSYLSTSTLEHRHFESGRESRLAYNEPNEYLRFSIPSRSASPIHLRPMLYPNLHDPVVSSHAASETLNLPPLYRVVPPDFRTGLGIALPRVTNSDASTTTADFARLNDRTLLYPTNEERPYRGDARWTPTHSNYALGVTQKFQIDPALFNEGVGISSAETGDGNSNREYHHISITNGRAPTSEHTTRQVSDDRRVVAREVTNSASPGSPDARNRSASRSASGSASSTTTSSLSSSCATRGSVTKDSPYTTEDNPVVGIISRPAMEVD